MSLIAVISIRFEDARAINVSRFDQSDVVHSARTAPRLRVNQNKRVVRALTSTHLNTNTVRPKILQYWVCPMKSLILTLFLAWANRIGGVCGPKLHQFGYSDADPSEPQVSFRTSIEF